MIFDKKTVIIKKKFKKLELFGKFDKIFTGLVILMNITKNENFSKKLRFLRIASEMTQGQLAEKIKISRSCLANYERGQRFPDESILEIIASFFDVSREYLVNKDEVFLPENFGKNKTLTSKKSRTKNGMIELSEFSPSSKIALSELYGFLEEK